ncbi:MAG: oligosaccharide flippase family protein [Bacteroidia bacterium]
MAQLNLQSSISKVSITLFGRIITAVVGIIFVPIYVKLIGAESYGLVAFYATLASALAVLDLGLSTAISRQVAILQVQQGKEKEMKDLVLSVEIIYWCIGILVGVLIVLLAHPIAVYWVKAEKLPVADIEKAVMLMGCVFAFQFPSSIYNGVMTGLEKQVANAVINVIFTLLKAVGVIAALKFIAPTIECYFTWQVVIIFGLTLALRIFVWKKLSASREKASFSVEQLRTIWRFAAGMTGISMITFFITEFDKIVISKMVLLEYVGYYNLAFLLAGGINQLISPMQPVIFPRLSALVAQSREADLVALYHKSARWIAIIVFPIGFTMIAFADDILLLWTHNPQLTANTAPILRVCAAGTICNCMMWTPYFYMLAKGNTTFTIYQNIIASVILVPLLFILARYYGALGASFVWLIVNAGYVLISIPVFHMKFLRGELLNWYRNDISRAFLFAFILTAAVKIFRVECIAVINIPLLAGILLFALAVYVLAMPDLREVAVRMKSRLSA